jgi:hypothetical protein
MRQAVIERQSYTVISYEFTSFCKTSNNKLPIVYYVELPNGRESCVEEIFLFSTVLKTNKFIVLENNSDSYPVQIIMHSSEPELSVFDENIKLSTISMFDEGTVKSIGDGWIFFIGSQK